MQAISEHGSNALPCGSFADLIVPSLFQLDKVSQRIRGPNGIVDLGDNGRLSYLVGGGVVLLKVTADNHPQSLVPHVLLAVAAASYQNRVAAGFVIHRQQFFGLFATKGVENGAGSVVDELGVRKAL